MSVAERLAAAMPRQLPPAGANLRRLLRRRHSLFRRGTHGSAPPHSRRTQGQYFVPLLRSRPHDVRPRGEPGTTERGPGKLCQLTEPTGYCESQGSLRQSPLTRDGRDHGHVEDDWYLYRGRCSGGHWNIAAVRMAGLPGQDNDGKLGTVRTQRSSKCGAPVELRWDEEASAR